MRIAILANEKTALFELGCAVELFGLPRPEFPGWYRAEVVTFSDVPISTHGGVHLQVRRLRSLRGFDMLVVPSWPVAEGEVSTELRRAALSLHQRGGRIVSFCSGAFLLGRLGLLDGREATTHWRYAGEFRRQFPQVSYLDDVLYVRAKRLGCSAGSAAALDLGLAIIREDFGHRIANQVARRLVISAHRSGGQAQFVEAPVPKRPDHLAATLDWVLKNLAAKLDVDALAQQARMSRRSFDRKFRQSLNCSPNEWITQQRLHRARELLEDCTHPVEIIAAMCGFQSAVTLRHHFRKQFGISPSQHRQIFFASRKLSRTRPVSSA